MNSLEKFKDKFSKVINSIGLLFLIEKIRDNVYPKSYLRIVNYHSTTKEFQKQFDKQMAYFSNKYYFFDMKKYDEYFNNTLAMDKPYLLLTFDDGYKNNYDVALEILNKYDAKACFFIVADDVNNDNNKMSSMMLKELIAGGHTIGSHTSTHHRFNDKSDTDELIKYELVDSKRKLEKMLGIKIDDFCWVGGEKDTYISRCESYIEDNYKHAFLTNGGVIKKKSNYNLIELI